jgi:hypothetical protein
MEILHVVCQRLVAAFLHLIAEPTECLELSLLDLGLGVEGELGMSPVMLG